MGKLHITPEFFHFFGELKQNNTREWFQANKVRYEKHVREPLLQFIREFDFRLRDISPSFVADARKVGGSLFRIHRDIRFSKDKSPYKTAAGVQFRHRMGKDVHAPGFYLHLEPDACFVGMGLWHPDNRTLHRIRERIVKNADDWRQITTSHAFKDHFEVGGDSLKRAPKGFDPEHPLIDDLRRKDFVISRAIPEKQTLSPGFIDQFADSCRAGAPYMRFLTEAIGLPW